MPFNGITSFLQQRLEAMNREFQVSMPFHGLPSFLLTDSLCQCPSTGWLYFYAQKAHGLQQFNFCVNALQRANAISTDTRSSCSG